MLGQRLNIDAALLPTSLAQIIAQRLESKASKESKPGSLHQYIVCAVCCILNSYLKLQNALT